MRYQREQNGSAHEENQLCKSLGGVVVASEQSSTIRGLTPLAFTKFDTIHFDLHVTLVYSSQDRSPPSWSFFADRYFRPSGQQWLQQGARL